MEDDYFTTYYKALHTRFLVVLVVDTENKQFHGYYVPVDGVNHREEAKTWRSAGTRAYSTDLYHFFGNQIMYYRTKDTDFTFA